MSVTTLAYDKQKGNYQLDLRIFLDDFMVVTSGGSESDYQPTSIFKKPSKVTIKNYLATHLSLTINGERLSLKVNKIKFEQLVIYITFHADDIPEPENIHEISASDTIFVDHFSNQRNVIHVELPDRRRRSLLFNKHYREGSISL